MDFNGIKDFLYKFSTLFKGTVGPWRRVCALLRTILVHDGF